MSDPNSPATTKSCCSTRPIRIQWRASTRTCRSARVTGQVTRWMRAANPYTFYTNGESGTGGSFPNNTPGLLQEVLQQYCQTNSLAPFDANGDSFIDGLFLVHA